MKIVNLHQHSEYSVKKAISTVSEIVGVVKSRPDAFEPFVCISDYNNAGSWAKLSKTCLKSGLKPIFSQEFYCEINDDKTTSYHLTLIAKDNDGIKNLIWLHNHAWENVYYVPKIKIGWLKEHSKGLICLSGCADGLLSSLILQTEMGDALRVVDFYKKYFEDFYIELVMNDYKIYPYLNKHLYELSKECSVPVVVTNDSKYTLPEHSEAHKIWVLSGEDFTISERDKCREHSMYCNRMNIFSSEEYDDIYDKCGFKDFAYDKDVMYAGLENAVKIAQGCTAELDTSVKLPRFENAEAKLKEKINVGFKSRGLTKTAIENVRREFNAISETCFNEYFLIMADLVEYCKEKKIVRGDRGSCAASYVSYCLGITSFNPQNYNLLLFDRFLSKDRVNPVWKDGKLYASDLPDIDIDHSPKNRDVVKEYLKEKYGDSNFAEVGNYQRSKYKSCIQDIARVFEVPLSDTLPLTKALPDDIDDKSLEEFTTDQLKEKFDTLRSYFNKYPNVASNVDILINKIRAMGHHASGVVILDRPIDDCLPVYMRDGVKLTVWFEGLEDRELTDNGVLKFDILGLKTLDIIQDTIDLINKTHSLSLTVSDIPIDDSETLQMLCDGETDFVFQLESNLGKSICKMIQPNSFMDVAIISGICRPGPLSVGIPQQVKDRKSGKVRYFIPEILKDILGETYGKTIFQESQILLCQRIGGMTATQANKLRKLLVKVGDVRIQREEIPKYKTIWDQNATKSLQPYFKSEMEASAYANELWSEMAAMAAYCFNFSHSASYTHHTMRTAYLKRHYFKEFMSVALSYEPLDKIRNYVLPIKRKGIDIVKPEINSSGDKFIVSESNFLYPLTHIKSITDVVYEEINKNRPYSSLNDFYSRINRTVVNKTKVESMILCGCFDSFGPRDALMIEYDKLRGNKIKEQYKYSEDQLSEFEVNLAGINFSRKSLYSCLKDSVCAINNEIKFPVELEEVSEYPVDVVGKIVDVKEKVSKNKRKYGIITMTDDIGSIDIFNFNMTDALLQLKGRVCIISIDKFKDGDKYLMSGNRSIKTIG